MEIALVTGGLFHGRQGLEVLDRTPAAVTLKKDVTLQRVDIAGRHR